MEQDGKNLSLLSSLPGRPHQESRHPGQRAGRLDPAGQTQVPLQNDRAGLHELDPALWARVRTLERLTEISPPRAQVARAKRHLPPGQLAFPLYASEGRGSRVECGRAPGVQGRCQGTRRTCDLTRLRA